MKKNTISKRLLFTGFAFLTALSFGTNSASANTDASDADLENAGLIYDDADEAEAKASALARNNYKDTVWDVWYEGDGSDNSTTSRIKEDYTSMWMNNVSSNTSLHPTPYATNAQSIYGVQAAASGNYDFPIGTKGYVKNLVKEKGYSMARFVIMTGKHSGTIRINCKWSPDSI